MSCKAKNCKMWNTCLVKSELVGEHHCDDYENGHYERVPRQSAYERTKSQVYATGNKWAIENFHATHD